MHLLLSSTLKLVGKAEMNPLNPLLGDKARAVSHGYVFMTVLLFPFMSHSDEQMRFKILRSFLMHHCVLTNAVLIVMKSMTISVTSVHYVEERE